ncbi:hypothetical protein Efla_001506 [Eimeria flavescens]
MPPPARPPVQFAPTLRGSRKPSAQPSLLLLQPLPLLLLLLLVAVGCTCASAAGQPLLHDEKAEVSRLETHTVERGEGTSCFEESEAFDQATEASVEDAAIPSPLSTPFRPPNSRTPNASAEGGKSRQQTRRRRAAGVAAAAVGVLLLLGVVRVLARRQPAATAEPEAPEAEETAKGEAVEPEEGLEGPLSEEKQRAGGTVTLQRAAAEAKRLMHILDDVARDAFRLTGMLGTSIDPEFVKQIVLALAEAGQQMQRLQQLQQRQEQQEQEQQEQAQQEGEWVSCWERFNACHTNIVARTYYVLSSFNSFLSSCVSKGKRDLEEIQRVRDAVHALSHTAEAVLATTDSDPLSLHLYAVESHFASAQKQLACLEPVAAQFKAMLLEHAQARAPPNLLLDAAFAASYKADYSRLRLQRLQREAGGWLREADQAALSVYRTRAAELQVELAQLQQQTEIIRFGLQTATIPEELASAKQRYLLAAAEVDQARDQMQQLQLELQAASESRQARRLQGEAKETLHKARAALQRLDPEQTAALLAAARAAAREQQELAGITEEEQQTKQLRSQLLAAVSPLVQQSMQAYVGLFEEKAKTQLEQLPAAPLAHFGELPSRRLFAEWNEALAALQNHVAALRKTARRMVAEENRDRLLDLQEEAALQATAAAAVSAVAAQLSVECRSWKRLEDHLAVLLDKHKTYSKAVGSFWTAERQQMGPKPAQVPRMQAKGDLDRSLAEAFSELSGEKAALLAAQLEEEVREAVVYMADWVPRMQANKAIDQALEEVLSERTSKEAAFPAAQLGEEVRKVELYIAQKNAAARLDASTHLADTLLQQQQLWQQLRQPQQQLLQLVQLVQQQQREGLVQQQRQGLVQQQQQTVLRFMQRQPLVQQASPAAVSGAAVAAAECGAASNSGGEQGRMRLSAKDLLPPPLCCYRFRRRGSVKLSSSQQAS